MAVSFGLRGIEKNRYEYSEVVLIQSIPSKNRDAAQQEPEGYQVHREKHVAENNLYIDLVKHAYVWVTKDVPSETVERILDFLNAEGQVEYTPHGGREKREHLAVAQDLQAGLELGRGQPALPPVKVDQVVPDKAGRAEERFVPSDCHPLHVGGTFTGQSQRVRGIPKA